jgi:drug/metabolite transporter (DMT)-like permease
MTISTFKPRGKGAVPLVLAAVALFAVFDTTIKTLGLLAPLVMVLWARYAFQVGVTALTVWPRRGNALFKTGKLKLQVLRGLSLLSVSALAFLSLKVMPVGEFTAIVMLTPLLTTLLAAVTLGEQVSVLRWLLVLAGLVCAIVVIRPHGDHFDGAMLLPLLLVLAGAAFHTLSSRLARSEDPNTTHLYTGLVGTLTLSIFLPGHWQALSPGTWGLLVLASALSSCGHYLLILAYMRAKAATLTPYLYFQIAFATLAGWVVFRHVPDAPALTGITGIAFCGALGTWLTGHEARSAEQATA